MLAGSRFFHRSWPVLSPIYNPLWDAPGNKVLLWAAGTIFAWLQKAPFCGQHPEFCQRMLAEGFICLPANIREKERVEGLPAIRQLTHSTLFRPSTRGFEPPTYRLGARSAWWPKRTLWLHFLLSFWFYNEKCNSSVRSGNLVAPSADLCWTCFWGLWICIAIIWFQVSSKSAEI